MAARLDLTQDPDLLDALLVARRGTAFFGRKLNELPDASLGGASLLEGWTRAHVIAHVGYNARALARLVEWANTGIETPMYSSPEARNEEILFGATLNPIALRNLYEHSAIHLNVEWRDTPEAAWSHQVKTAQGRTVPASETVWMRTREVWLHAVDLDNGAGFNEIPAQVLTRLLGDVVSAWRARGELHGLLLRPDDNGLEFGATDADSPEVVSGPLPQLAAWATGRPSGGLVSSHHGMPSTPPRWI
jgi:maleylpyruvate isomerase